MGGMKYDLIVIGGGPAGYVAAIRAAQLGKSVLCIERGRVGGTCLNRGCIPTKALLTNAELYRTLSMRSAEFGIRTGELSVDWQQVIARARSVSERLSNGIAFLFRKHKVTLAVGEARLAATGQVELQREDGTTELLEGEHVLIATGARSREIPAFPFNGKTIINSTDALNLPELPKRLLVIGSGAIGTEISYIYHSFGSQVTLVEALPHLLPQEDEELSVALERSFRAQGIRCLTGAKVQSLEAADGVVTATLSTTEGQEQQLQADVCLVAVGVVPVVPEAPGLELTERGFIKVYERYRTSLPRVYAAGDCIGGVMLAHSASYEAVQAVEGMFNPAYTPRRPEHIPSCIYCHPQVASVGKRERELRAEGVAYKVGRFPLQASGRAVAAGETEGFVKLLFGSEDGELLGAHLVGANATELIAVPGLALNAELTDADLHAMIYAHPTLAESIHEAVLAADGIAIHA